MSDQDALLGAIWDAPNDDTPRLVYADWLQENGDPEHAEFIRVQIAAALSLDDTPQRVSLVQQSRDLLSQHLDDWVAPYAWIFTGSRPTVRTVDPPFWPIVDAFVVGIGSGERVLPSTRAPSVVFQRGFVASCCPWMHSLLQAKLADLAPRGPRSIINPIRSTVESDRRLAPILPQLANRLTLDRFSGWSIAIDSADLGDVLRYPSVLHGLNSLNVPRSEDVECLVKLFFAAPRLEQLYIHGIFPRTVVEASLRAAVESGLSQRLTHLTVLNLVDEDEFDVPAFFTTLIGYNWPRLECLAIGGSGDLPLAGIKASSFPRLKELRLGANPTTESVTAVLECSALMHVPLIQFFDDGLFLGDGSSSVDWEKLIRRYGKRLRCSSV